LDFHQNIVETENKFISTKTIEVVQDLINLYKCGVEYYSAKSPKKAKDYILRLQTFLSDKTVLKLIEQNSKPNGKPRSRSSVNLITISKIEAVNSDKKKRQSVLFSLEINKLNFDRQKIDYKTYLSNCDLETIRAQSLLDESAKKQREDFLFNLRNKHLLNHSHRGSRKQSYIKRVNIENYKLISSFSPSKKNSRNAMDDFISPIKPKELNFNKIKDSDTSSSKNRKKKISKRNLNFLFEGFLNKFHSAYFENYSEKGLELANDIIIEGYNKKKKKNI